MIEYNELVAHEPPSDDWQELVAGIRTLLLSMLGVIYLWVIYNATLV